MIIVETPSLLLCLTSFPPKAACAQSHLSLQSFRFFLHRRLRLACPARRLQHRVPSCDRRYRLPSECLFDPIAATVSGETAPIVQTLTTDLIIGLHANQPHTD